MDSIAAHRCHAIKRAGAELLVLANTFVKSRDAAANYSCTPKFGASPIPSALISRVSKSSDFVLVGPCRKCAFQHGKKLNTGCSNPEM